MLPNRHKIYKPDSQHALLFLKKINSPKQWYIIAVASLSLFYKLLSRIIYNLYLNFFMVYIWLRSVRWWAWALERIDVVSYSKRFTNIGVDNFWRHHIEKCNRKNKSHLSIGHHDPNISCCSCRFRRSKLVSHHCFLRFIFIISNNKQSL